MVSGEYQGWRVPSGGQIDKTYAAGAVQTALEALEKGDFSEKFLSVYQKRWKKELQPKFDTLQQMALAARNADQLNQTMKGLAQTPEVIASVLE